MSLETNKKKVLQVLVIIVVASFITPFMTNSINLAIPAIGLEYGGTQAMLNWLLTAYLLSMISFILPFGQLADIVGRERFFIFGTFLFSITSIACGLAFSLGSLILFRILQGAAAAAIFGTLMSILSSAVPPQERGKAIGIASASAYIGLSVGPVLGGVIIYYITWRGIFFFEAALSLATVVLSLFWLRGEWTKTKAQKFDLTGSLICILGFSFVLFGLARLAIAYYYSFVLILGLMFLWIFVKYESKIPHPLLPVDLLKNNLLFRNSNLAALINYCANFALLYIMSLYLQAVLVLDSKIAGLILIAQPLAMAIVSPLTGKLSDSIEPRILSSLGMGLSGLGLFLFIFLGDKTGLVLIVLNLCLLGFGFALFSSPNTNAVMGSVERSYYGVASSIYAVTRMSGGAVSLAILSLINSFYIKDLKISSPEYVSKFLASLRVSLIVFTVICIGGIYVSLARGSVTKKEI